MGLCLDTVQDGLAYCAPLDFATIHIALAATALFPALLWSGRPVKPAHPWETLLIGAVQITSFLMLQVRRAP